MTDDDKALDKIIRTSMPFDFERKETLSDDKALVDRLRNPHGHSQIVMRLEAADRIEAQAAEIEFHKERADALVLQADEWEGKYLIGIAEIERINHANQELRSENERLREAGGDLGFYAGHDDSCDCVKGWARGPCNCGYTEAWKAWRVALGEGND